MGLKGIIISANNILNDFLVPLVFALCIFYFIWGIIKYMKDGASSEKAAEEGKRIMVWGIIALFVLSSIWGIIRILQSEFNIPDVNSSIKISR